MRAYGHSLQNMLSLCARPCMAKRFCTFVGVTRRNTRALHFDTYSFPCSPKRPCIFACGIVLHAKIITVARAGGECACNTSIAKYHNTANTFCIFSRVWHKTCANWTIIGALEPAQTDVWIPIKWTCLYDGSKTCCCNKIQLYKTRARAATLQWWRQHMFARVICGGDGFMTVALRYVPTFMTPTPFMCWFHAVVKIKTLLHPNAKARWIARHRNHVMIHRGRCIYRGSTRAKIDVVHAHLLAIA